MEDLLLENRRSTIQITGRVSRDENGRRAPANHASTTTIRRLSASKTRVLGCMPLLGTLVICSMRWPKILWWSGGTTRWPQTRTCPPKRWNWNTGYSPSWKRCRLPARTEEKRFQQDDGDHYWFFFWTSDAKKTTSPHQDKPRQHEGPWGWLAQGKARQARVSKIQFLELVDCPISREQYQGLLEGGGHVWSDGSNLCERPIGLLVTQLSSIP